MKLQRGEGLGGGFSRIQHLANCVPYYWRRFKSLPYGAARRLTRREARDYPIMEPFFKDKYGL